MNILKTLLPAVFLLIFKGALCQVSLNIKEKIKPKESFTFQKISATPAAVYLLGIDDNGERSTYYLEKYNSSSLTLEYQNNLNICEDDKDALVHPLFTPPFCFEFNNQIVVFYTSYKKGAKTSDINVKTTNDKGEVKSGFTNLISSKDIEVQMEGMYWNLIGYYKPVISYYLSDDKTTVIIEIDSPKFHKIYTYALSDLLAGKTNTKEYDILKLTKAENLNVERCFCIKNQIYFSYIKQINDKKGEFGMAAYDGAKFNLAPLKLNTNDVFSVDYMIPQNSSNLFVAGYERIIVDNSKPLKTENSKVKMFNVLYNTSSASFGTINEFDFNPAVAKHISVPKTSYGFIKKDHTPNQYLERIAFIESPSHYFQISHLLFGKEPYGTAFGANPLQGGGVTTIGRDILVSKFDKTGKLIGQYLIPRHTYFNTFAGSRSGTLWAFANKQRNSNFILKGDDLHFFYRDNTKNTYNQAAYDPNETKACDKGNSSLAHFSLKGDVISREILLDEEKNSIFFYSSENLMFNNCVILDSEDGRKMSNIAKATIN